MKNFDAEAATYLYWQTRIKASLCGKDTIGVNAKARPYEWHNYAIFKRDVGLMPRPSDKLTTARRGEPLTRENVAWRSYLVSREIYLPRNADSKKQEEVNNLLEKIKIKNVLSKRDYTLSKRSTALGLVITLTDATNYRRTAAIWFGMWNRCTNSKNPNYARYKNRTPDDRWKVFQNFLKDMGERPGNLSIDRIDNTKGYSSLNCRWATAEQQANNTCRSVRVELPDGTKITKKALEALPECEVTAQTYIRRRAKGVPHDLALSKAFKFEVRSGTNVGGNRAGRWLFAGELKTLNEIALELNMPYGTIKSMLRDSRAAARKRNRPVAVPGEAFPLSAIAYRKPEAQAHREWLKARR